MKSSFTILDVLRLKNGNLAISGVSQTHLPLTMRGRGITVSGDVEIEIVSIGLVNPPPADKNRQDLLVRLLKGEISSLKGATIFFDSE